MFEMIDNQYGMLINAQYIKVHSIILYSVKIYKHYSSLQKKFKCDKEIK